MSLKGKLLLGMARCESEVEQVRLSEHIKNQVCQKNISKPQHSTHSKYQKYKHQHITLSTYHKYNLHSPTFFLNRIPPRDIWKPDLLLYNRSSQITFTIF